MAKKNLCSDDCGLCTMPWTRLEMYFWHNQDASQMQSRYVSHTIKIHFRCNKDVSQTCMYEHYLVPKLCIIHQYKPIGFKGLIIDCG